MKASLLKEDKSLKRILVVVFPRWLKIVFFLITMLFSLLLFSVPIILAIADAFLPSAFFSAAAASYPSPLINFRTLYYHLTNYDFRFSLIDIPLVSIARSAIILCVYSLCDGPRLSSGAYLGTAAVCSVSSLVFVSVKAACVFTIGGGYSDDSFARAMEAAMFVSSWVLGIGHVAVAYRTSCRERRKLLVYKIDVEAVSACKNGFPRHQKILQDARIRSK